jgi:signal transduction histidine kinase
MQNIWEYISYLGLNGSETPQERRTIILTNKLNFVLAGTMFLLVFVIFTIQLMYYSELRFGMGVIRVVVLFFVSSANLILARYRYNQASKFSLIFVTPLIFLVLPILKGFVEEESYVYYPYILITASVIPQLLLNTEKEKRVYWLSIIYYFILVMVIDNLMMYFQNESFPIIERIRGFYPFYKLAPAAIFIFIFISIRHLRKLNFRFEEELRIKNADLDMQNQLLKFQKAEIERQKDEIINKEVQTWQKMVNIISHEVVNSAIPITNLAGMTRQMLEDESGNVIKPESIGEDVTVDIHHSLKVIESRTLAVINFVKATKSLTQIPRPNIRKIPVAEIFDRIAVLYQAKFKETGIRFKQDINPADLSFEADLELIEQVIINLVQNAIEALVSVNDPVISIRASKNESDHVQISVSDNGHGISPEVVEKIFLPFYSTKVKSTGIGLSLAQQIMMLHHGRLIVVEGLEKGASFLLIF